MPGVYLFGGFLLIKPNVFLYPRIGKSEKHNPDTPGFSLLSSEPPSHFLLIRLLVAQQLPPPAIARRWLLQRHPGPPRKWVGRRFQIECERRLSRLPSYRARASRSRGFPLHTLFSWLNPSLSRLSRWKRGLIFLSRLDK